jgi:hypothetical protein
MKNYDEMMRKRFEEMARGQPMSPYRNIEDVGFAQARKDLTWVKRTGMPGAPPPKK